MGLKGEMNEEECEDTISNHEPFARRNSSNEWNDIGFGE